MRIHIYKVIKLYNILIQNVVMKERGERVNHRNITSRSCHIYAFKKQVFNTSITFLLVLFNVSHKMLAKRYCILRTSYHLLLIV